MMQGKVGAVRIDQGKGKWSSDKLVFAQNTRNRLKINSINNRD